MNALYGRPNGDGYPRRPQPEAGRRRAAFRSRAPSGRASAASGCGRTGITCLRQLRRGVAGASCTAPADAVEPPTRASCRALREEREMCSLRRGRNVILPGQYYDVETGLAYNTARDYDASTGRYVESDPIGLDGGSYSTHAYANGNPASVTDPLGLAPPGRTAPSPASPGIWPSSGPFDQSWSQAVQNTAQQITDAVDNAIEAVKAACKTCPDCSPYKKGTIGYIGPHTDHDHYNKTLGRYLNPHLNLFVVQQNPKDCKCFWRKPKPDDSAEPPPLPGWVDLNNGFPPLTP